MGALASVLLVIISIAAAVSALMVLLMLAEDRGSEQPRWFQRLRAPGTPFGIFLIVFAGFSSWQAWEADRSGTIIPATYKTGWMTPQQGYAVAILLLIAGCYAIFLSVRECRKKGSNTSEGT